MDDRGREPRILRFGNFELELESRELRKGGAPIKLQSQHFQLLALLAGRAGQVVSREEIRRALWDNETFVDFDQSINFCVNKIRGAWTTIRRARGISKRCLARATASLRR